MNKNVTNPFIRPPLHPARIPDASSQGDWGAQDCARHVGPWKEVRTQTIAEKSSSLHLRGTLFKALVAALRTAGRVPKVSGMYPRPSIPVNS